MSCPVDADAERKRYRDDCSESLGSVERTKARKTRREEVSHPSASSSGRVVDMDADRLTTEVSRLKKLLEAERENSRVLRNDLDNLLKSRETTSESDKEKEGSMLHKRFPSYTSLQDLWLKERSMNVLKEGITIVDCSLPDFPIIYANEGFTRMTGYSESETLGRNCRFLQGPKTELAQINILRQAVSQRKSCAVELTNYRKNGELFINYLSLTPIIDNNGKLTHYVGIQSDITELIRRKQAEIEAKDAANKAQLATEAKSQFLARMSHEIRTPLNGMIAVGQLLAETKLTHQQRDLVNTIRCSGETLLALITDILDFSRIEANKLSLHLHDFNLQSIMEDAIEIAGLKAAQKKLHVAYSLSPHVPETLRGDSTRIKQVLLNVLYNAVKFTESGYVYLEASVQVCDTQMLHCIPNGARVQGEGANEELVPSYSKSDISENDTLYLIHFSVRDTGLGMTAEGLSRLFISFSQLEEMSTRRYGGTGLGLAISRKLCEAMGGEMWAESKGLGQGSTFHCTVKCHERAPGAGSHDKTIEGAKVGSHTNGKEPLETQSTDKSYKKVDLLAGKACLLIEENDVVRESLAKAMRAWGLKVTALSSEQSALAYLFWPESRSGNKNNIKLDFVIVDKNCVELTKSLANEKRHDVAVCFIVWPAADDINGIGDISKNILSPLEGDNHIFPHLCVQRPVRHGRLKMALEELCVAQRDEKLIEPHKPASVMRPVDETNFANRRILIAEDNVINMKVCLGILRRLGCTDIVTAEDGVLALAEIDAYGGPDYFDVIFMDLHMPRKGGMEVVKELVQRHKHIKAKVVAVTADAFAETKELCFKEGFSHWIAKPYRINDIEKVLDFSASDQT